MRDFDADARPGETFRVAGEVFTLHSEVRPESFLPWLELTTDASNAESLAVMDGVIIACLATQDDKDRWSAVRAREDNAIGRARLLEILQFVTEAVSGSRPTVPSSPSSTTPGRRGRSSTAASDSPVGLVSTG